MKTPWHLWVVGIVSLLWNAMGAVDYFMTATRNAAYMQGFTQAQLDYFYSFPAWSVATWAVGVWFAVLGSVLLLMKRPSALWAFIVSFVGMVLTSFYNYVLADVKMTDVVGPEAMIFSVVIFVVALLLVIYARRMKMSGILA